MKNINISCGIFKGKFFIRYNGIPFVIRICNIYFTHSKLFALDRIRMENTYKFSINPTYKPMIGDGILNGNIINNEPSKDPIRK